MSDILAYIGTYTREGGKGIYIHRYDADTGALTPVGSVESENPSFLAIHPSGRFLYAVNEVGEYKGEQAGAISAFAIGADATELTLINQQSTKGTGPCHVSIDATGRYAVVANYGGGSTCLLPIADTGALGEASDFVQHEGCSVNPQRQQGPHAHSANISPDNKYVYVADLGLDKVLIYQLRPRPGQTHRKRPALCFRRARTRPAPLCLSPGWTMRLSHQRNRQYRRGLCPRRRHWRLNPAPIHLHIARRVLGHQPHGGYSRFLRLCVWVESRARQRGDLCH